MTPNEWLDHICIKKTNWNSFTEDQQKTYLPYIINLFLSMAPELIEVVNEVQKQQVPNKDHYNFYKTVLPKKKLFFRWLKAKKKEYSKDVVERIAAFYSISTREIYDSICILSQQNIIDILKQIGTSDKDIKKLLK